MSWQIRRSTGAATEQVSYAAGDRVAMASRTGLRSRGGRRSSPAELVEHVATVREAGGIMAEKVLCARDSIQAAFSGYVKIHRGFDARPSSRHDSEVLAGRGGMGTKSEPAFSVDAFFNPPLDSIDASVDGSKTVSRPTSGSATPIDEDVAALDAPPVLPLLSSVAAIASLQVRTARSRRDMRGKHIENMGIERCGDDVLSHCADEGRLAQLKALKTGLETHILYQELDRRETG